MIIKTGLWVELWAIIGFLVGLGLASLMGQRTVPVVLLIVYEIVLTPLFSRTPITHLIPVQRALVGLAMANIEPAGLPAIFGGQGNGRGFKVACSRFAELVRISMASRCWQESTQPITWAKS